LEALVTQIGFTDNEDREVGLMIRQSLEPGAPYVACVVERNGLVSLQYRNVAGSATNKILFSIANAEMIQLEKKGNAFTMSAAKFGEDYERRSIELTGFSDTQYAGFYVSSNSANDREIVRFSHVRFFEEIKCKIEN